MERFLSMGKNSRRVLKSLLNPEVHTGMRIQTRNRTLQGGVWEGEVKVRPKFMETPDLRKGGQRTLQEAPVAE